MVRNIDGSYIWSNMRDRVVGIDMINKSGRMVGYMSWFGNYW